ncbi:hypothetical protein ACFQZ2_05505 [Streptomonospora algeriensis]|uniref:EF-hand domain-containing protein n=1 Tax=Streptomonospora algeriensis TaxID=995084 RepID=A0ABW3BA87_9ACTN
MHDTTIELPVHPVTGMTALGWRRNGAAIWPVLGGDGTTPADGDGDGSGGEGGEPASGGTGDTDPDGDGGEGGEGDPDGAGELGDAGKKALAAQKEKWKSERQKRQEAERRLAELEAAAKKDGGEDDPETIRRKAQAEVMSAANQRIVSAEVRAAAASKLADPADAAHFLDLSKFEVDDSGDVDSEEIGEAIEDLLKRKPYLAAGATKRFQGSGDSGQGRGYKQPSLDQQIAEAEKAGDTMRAISLKHQKLNQNN